MKHPSILSAESLILRHSEMREVSRDVWVPARPSGYPSFGQRLKAASLVFTGKADAVIWEGGQ